MTWSKEICWHEIHSRFKLRETKKAIARAVGLSVQTVRKILRQKQPLGYVREKQESELLGPYQAYILQRLAAVAYCAQATFEELQVRGYRGSYQTVKRFVSPLRKEAEIEATVRFETPPGRQGQADWGQCWTMIAGKRVRNHLFVLTLGYLSALTGVNLITILWILVTLATKPDDMELLKAFYRRARPLGFWGPVRKACGGDVFPELRRPLAKGFSLAARGFGAVIALILGSATFT